MKPVVLKFFVSFRWPMLSSERRWKRSSAPTRTPTMKR